MNMMRKSNYFGLYISCINTFTFYQLDFGCYKYISFDLFS
jgi:hypothetical protein